AGSVWVRAPFLARAKRSGDTSCGHDGSLELLRGPLCHRRCDRRALGRHAEHVQRSGAMVPVVGVQPNPAIGGPLMAGKRIPQGAEVAVQHANMAFAPESHDRVQAIDPHLAHRLAVTIRQQPRSSERGGSDRRGRGGCDPKYRGQRGISTTKAQCRQVAHRTVHVRPHTSHRVPSGSRLALAAHRLLRTDVRTPRPLVCGCNIPPGRPVTKSCVTVSLASTSEFVTRNRYTFNSPRGELPSAHPDVRGDGSTVRTFVRASGMKYPVWRDA